MHPKTDKKKNKSGTFFSFNGAPSKKAMTPDRQSEIKYLDLFREIPLHVSKNKQRMKAIMTSGKQAIVR